MQSVSSRIWTRIAVFISYGDNDNTTGTSKGERCAINLISGLIVKILDYGIVVREFESQSHNYVYFWINTRGKGMKFIFLLAMVSN